MKRISMAAIALTAAMISAPSLAQTGSVGSLVACGPACAPSASPGTGVGTPGGGALPTLPGLPPTLGSPSTSAGCPVPAGLASGGTTGFGRGGLGARFRR